MMWKKVQRLLTKDGNIYVTIIWRIPMAFFPSACHCLIHHVRIIPRLTFSVSSAVFWSGRLTRDAIEPIECKKRFDSNSCGDKGLKVEPPIDTQSRRRTQSAAKVRRWPINLAVINYPALLHAASKKRATCRRACDEIESHAGNWPCERVGN